MDAAQPAPARPLPEAEAAPEPARPPRRPVMRQYELVEKVKAYDPTADEDLLNRAYVYAMKAHGAQVRASGDPYFSHPVEVAGLLAGLKLDSASIATGLLHDTIEDTGATVEELERLFGGEIARLVDGVTKLNKLELQSAHTEQAENFRKLLLAMSEDIRVLLVKLADRLHNMRTLHFIGSEEKRRRIANETVEIYAPLAERIGMQALKDELEDRAFEALQSEAREAILNRLKRLRKHDSNLIERIVSELHDTLIGAGIESRISGREKTPVSIWRKMKRKNISFEQLSDIMAFRITVDSVPSCYAALGVIHGKYAMVPERFKDFISTPKPNGYRSLHTTIIGPERRRIEVQIRTAEMHQIAELGVAAHWAYKQRRPAVTNGRQYRWIRGLLEILEHAAGPEEFLEHTKLEMFQDHVFCFTPRGDLIEMPRGATPVDFAYAVHSEVGDTCVGAKVNGRLVPLRTRLNHGDQVEIITARASAPSPAWERFVVTGKARSRIRRYIRTQQRNDFIAHGREQLQRAGQKVKVAVTDRRLDEVLKEVRQKSVDDLLAAVGEGALSARVVVEALRGPAGPTLTESPPDKVIPLRRPRLPSAATADGYRIQGLLPGIAVQLAGCCHPVPGDQIVGVVRTGRGVTVHRGDCRALMRRPAQSDRFLDLGWVDGAPDKKAIGRIQVMSINQPGSLGSLSTVIGKQGGNITDVRFSSRSRDVVEIVLDIEVDDVEHLERIQASLRANPVVTSVERAQG
ncbi:MAG TPA: bifunctional (p)ppGpp synthetase/guanosine-3',5'-bis(diphosphate) 3'-pyrophosphohydrolase [Geminicoccaceae bacterium]